MKVRLLCTAIAGLFTASMSNALIAAEEPDKSQAASPSSAREVERIVVTATKRSENIEDVNVAVTAIGEKTLDRLQARSFDDYARLVPGLILDSNGPTSTRLTLRGLSSGGVGSTTAIYFDELPLGSSNALANGAVVTSNYDTWDLQRIEVLRGPQGTEYGASAEGGLLKFVTNAPSFQGFSGAVQAGGEGVASGETVGSIRAMINAPLNDYVAFRLSAYDVGIPGFIDNPQLNLKNVNGGKKTGGRASFLFHPGSNFSARLTASTQDIDTSGTPSMDVVGSALTPENPPSNRFDPLHGDLSASTYYPTTIKGKLSTVDLTMGWDVDWATVTSVSGYSRTRQYTRDDNSSVLIAPATDVGSFISAAVTGFPTGLFRAADINLKKYTQELRLASVSPRPFEWQLGAFYAREETDLTQDFFLFDQPTQAILDIPAGNTHIAATYKELAGFANATYHFTPVFDLSAGGRFSRNKQVGRTTLGPGILTGAGDDYSTPSSESTSTYSIAPRWKLGPDTMVYARVASGFRPGGPNLVPIGTPGDVPRFYNSDSTLNTEIGVRTNLLDNKLSLDVAAFNIDWTDMQVLVVINSTGINANAGKANSKGFEWSLGYAPTRNLKFSWVGAYIDAKLKSDAPGIGGVSGDQLPSTPKWSHSLDGEYTWQAASNVRAFAGTTYSYVGERYTDFSTQDFVNPHTLLPSYNTLNLRAGVVWDGYTLQLLVKNATDSRGMTSYNNSGAPNLGGIAGVIQPRTIALVVDKRF